MTAAGPRASLTEVREPRELLGEILVLSLLALGAHPGQRLLERLLLAAKLADPLGDQLGLDPLLERLHLRFDLALELGDLLADPGPGELSVAALIAIVVAKSCLASLSTLKVYALHASLKPYLGEAPEYPGQELRPNGGRVWRKSSPRRSSDESCRESTRRLPKKSTCDGVYYDHFAYASRLLPIMRGGQLK